jgi:hypothetical protein
MHVMKRTPAIDLRVAFGALALLGLLAGSAAAAREPPSGSEAPPAMSPEQRAEAWRRLPPEQRARAWQQLTPEQRAEAWRRMSPEQRQTAREQVRPVEREAMREHWLEERERRFKGVAERGRSQRGPETDALRRRLSPEERLLLREQIRESNREFGAERKGGPRPQRRGREAP